MHTHHHVACVISIAVLMLAAPALAQPLSTTAPAPAPVPPTPPAGAAGNADGDGDRVEREGPFVTASLGLGAELQLGWMLAPWFGAFASFGGYDGGNVILPGGKVGAANVSLQGGGLRLGSGVGFAEVQIASLTTTNACDFDDPCLHREALGAILGAGLEIVHTRHFGLHLRAQFVIDRHDVVPLIQLGLGFYL